MKTNIVGQLARPLDRKKPHSVGSASFFISLFFFVHIFASVIASHL